MQDTLGYLKKAQKRHEQDIDDLKEKNQRISELSDECWRLAKKNEQLQKQLIDCTRKKKHSRLKVKYLTLNQYCFCLKVQYLCLHLFPLLVVDIQTKTDWTSKTASKMLKKMIKTSGESSDDSSYSDVDSQDSDVDSQDSDICGAIKSMSQQTLKPMDIDHNNVPSLSQPSRISIEFNHRNSSTNVMDHNNDNDIKGNGDGNETESETNIQVKSKLHWFCLHVEL